MVATPYAGSDQRTFTRALGLPLADLGFILESKIGALNVVIKCDEGLNVGTLEKEGKSKGTITIRNCNIFERGQRNPIAGCMVEPITFEFKGEPTAVAPIKEEWTGAKAGSVFSEVKVIPAGCGINATYNLEGKKLCTLPDNAVEKAAHVFDCVGGDTNLKLAGVAATMIYPEIALVQPPTFPNWKMG